MSLDLPTEAEQAEKKRAAFLARHGASLVIDEVHVERFLRACAWRSSSLLNKADLARDIGIAPSTANQWLSVLEASGQILLLEPWFSKRTRSIVKSPKLYLSDSGLLCALLNIRSVAELRQAPAAGLVCSARTACRRALARPGRVDI